MKIQKAIHILRSHAHTVERTTAQKKPNEKYKNEKCLNWRENKYNYNIMIKACAQPQTLISPPVSFPLPLPLPLPPPQAHDTSAPTLPLPRQTRAWLQTVAFNHYRHNEGGKTTILVAARAFSFQIPCVCVCVCVLYAHWQTKANTYDLCKYFFQAKTDI